MADGARIAACIRALLAARAPDASICPSEVARALWPAPHWRSAMPAVRDIAVRLARDGALSLTQSGTLLDPDAPVHGPIRLRRGPAWPGDAASAACEPPVPRAVR